MSQEPKPVAGAPKTILVVDASPETAQLISEAFEGSEWVMEHVSSNKDALAFVQGRHFDVVLTSERTGAAEDVELLRRIRRVHPHSRVIILAAPGAPAEVISAIQEHAFSYFTAPFEADQFREMLCTAMESPAWDDGIELKSATESWIRLYARADYTTADRLVQFIKEIAEDLAVEERGDLSFAFREMLLNAMEHGGRFDPNEYIEISYLRSRRAVSCRIRDSGQGFSMEEIRHSALSNGPEDPWGHVAVRESLGLRPGGFGILVTRNLVDELIYNEKGNEVILIKYLDKDRACEEKAGLGS